MKTTTQKTSAFRLNTDSSSGEIGMHTASILGYLGTQARVLLTATNEVKIQQTYKKGNGHQNVLQLMELTLPLWI